MIYFDNAATTKPYPETVKTYADLSLGLLGNSSAANGLGTVCAEYLEKARQQIQNSLHASGFELYFTSGATESNNEAILGYARRHKKEGKRVITSQGEHASVLNVFEELEKEGFEVIYLPLASDGSLPLTELEQAVNQETILVSLMWVNNEIGTIYPIADFASYVHAHSSAAFMSDLTQALGKTAIDFSCLDFFTMSGHKVGGLKSSGLLGVRQGLVLDPIFYGGGQEGGERPGTVNVPLACS
jgi:cysteine desulfurase